MTDEKAKEILDFLARKMRYSSFVWFDGICNISNSISGYLPCVIDIKNYRHNLYLIKKLKEPRIFGYNKLLAPGYAAALSCLLESSNDGYDIETDYKGEVFLPAYSSLEQILVEMDLNKSLETSL